MKKAILAVFVIVFALASCSTAQSSKPGPGGIWQLSSISGVEKLDALYSGRKPMINFKNGEVSGNNGCNGFSGKIYVRGNKVDFNQSKFLSTMMACEGNGEKTFMEALSKTDHYAISDDGKTLSLLHGSTELMRFVKQ